MRHLLNIADLSAAEFHDLLAVAAYLKRRRAARMPEHVLAGQTLAMVFEKPSLRTRVSFELAMTELGGHAMYIRGEELGIGVRETIEDVARVFGHMVHGIMARVFRHETVAGLAQHAGVPVINGLSDLSHPCQALGDFLTIREHCGRIDGLKLVYIGDANNVCRSLAQACLLAGSKLVVACPRAYAFTPADIASFGSAWGAAVEQVHDPREAVRGAHVLYTDVWTSMGQEAERAARLDAFQGYQINEALLALAGPQARILHCLPAHRGEEITHGAIESAQSVVFDQAENRLHAQKAVLRLLLGAEPERVIAAARA
jgi:ornithine carbamoyltransferase